MKSRRTFPKDPVIEVYKAGIDRSLLGQNLARSVAERLVNLVALQPSVAHRPAFLSSGTPRPSIEA